MNTMLHAVNTETEIEAVQQSDADFFNPLNWVKISKPLGGSNAKMRDDIISFIVTKASKKDLRIIAARLRFGAEVVKKLGWKTDDRIVIYFHPDDLMQVMLLKSDTGQGNKLVNDGRPGVLRMSLTLPESLSERVSVLLKMNKLRFYKKQLAFNVRDGEKS